MRSFFRPIFLLISILLSSCASLTETEYDPNILSGTGCTSWNKAIPVPAGFTRMIVATSPSGFETFIGPVYIGRTPIDKLVPSGIPQDLYFRIGTQLQKGRVVFLENGKMEKRTSEFTGGISLPKIIQSTNSCTLSGGLVPPPPGMARLMVRTKPNLAMVYVNNIAVGQTPLAINLNSTLNPVPILIKYPGYPTMPSYSYQVRLAPGDTIDIERRGD